MGCYARAVAKAPYVFIIVDVLLAMALGPLTAYYHGIPDFSDPLSGFEPRGTPIRGWMNSAYFIHIKMYSGEYQLAPGIVFNTTGVDELNINTGAVLPPSDEFIKTDMSEPMQIPRIAVVPVVDGHNILTLPVLQSICDFKHQAVMQYCEPKCSITTLGDVMAELRGTTCLGLTESDVVLTRGLLQMCAPFYFNESLTRNCSVDDCHAPAKCKERDAVYRILNDYTDKGFLKDGDVTAVKVSYTMLFIQWRGTGDTLRTLFTERLGENEVSNGVVKIKGIDLTIPQAVFRWYVIQDLVWYGLAMGLVVLLLVIYLRSFILMITVVLNVMFSLLLAYWAYFMVFRFTFFPFINILAALLLIALGADDLFIFYDIWRDEKVENPSASYEELVSLVLYKGGTSVFVTSFTTAAALLANFVNEVTAIRCFGAFAAICVFVNFLLFITWVPAIIVVTDYAYNSCLGDDFCHDKDAKVWQCLFRVHDAIWRRLMPKILNKAASFWIILSFMLTIGALVATFWKPRLDLPSTNGLRLLVPNHPFEVYEWHTKAHMRFEKDADLPINIQLLWGAKASDNGVHYDPEALGHLVKDDGFDIYVNTSQTWLSSLCDTLMMSDFIDYEFRDSSKCYWEYYRDYITQPCDGSDTRRCCGQPFPPSYMMSKVCMAELAYGMHSRVTTNTTSDTLIGLPLFDKTNNITTFQMFFQTPYRWTAKYGSMSRIYAKIEDFMTSQLRNAPSTVNDGWFTGAYLFEFRFFDLQKSLASGTLMGIGVSLAIGCAVLLVTTMNILLTFYAIVTIALVLATTAGVLALMGWELNTTEALILTLSMGLSIDFTIHNGVAYKMAPYERREDKVKDTLATVGSAITMAALTTFAAGAAMMCGSVWAYRQFGIFLALTMVFSWFYSNFFFLSLCATIGPEKRVGDISCLFTWMKQLSCKKKNHEKEQHKTRARNGVPRRLPQPLPPPDNDFTASQPRREHDSAAETTPDDDAFPMEDDLANFAYPNTGFSDEPPEVLPRRPIVADLNNSSAMDRRGPLPNPDRTHSPVASDSPHDFNYKHLQQHRKSRHREELSTSSTSSSAASFPSLYARSGQETRFNPPVRNGFNKNHMHNITRAVHSHDDHRQ